MLIAVSTALYFSNALGLLVHAWLRSSVRERYGIAGTLSDDALQVCVGRVSCDVFRWPRLRAPR